MTTQSETQRILDATAERERFWQERNDAIREVWKILEMEDANKVPGYPSTVIPELKSGFDFGVHILSSNPVRHKMPMSFTEGEDDIQKRKKGKGERFLHGNWRVIDAKRRRSGRESYQRELAGWTLGTGWYCAYATVRILEDGTPDFVADLWDISEVFPEWGGLDDGLVVLDRQYVTTLEEFKRRAERNGWDTGGLSGSVTERVTILDHWESRYNRLNPRRPDILNGVYLVSKGQSLFGSVQMPVSVGKQIKELERDADLTHIPVFLGPVNGMPTPAAYYANAHTMSRRWGQSMLENAKITYRTINQLYQWVLSDVKTAAMRTYLDKNPSGDVTVTPEELNKATNVIARRSTTGEDLEKLDQSTAIGSLAPVLDDLNARTQRSLLPWTQFGQAPFSLSGVAIERLNEQARAVLGAAITGMNQVYGDIDYLWLTSYKQLAGAGRVTRPLQLAGRIRSTGTSGYYDEEFAPDDLPNTYWVDVEIKPSLPMDMQIKAATAAQLRPGEKQVPLEWVLENILDVDDPSLIMRATREEEAYDLPAVRIKDTIQKLRKEIEVARKRGDPPEAVQLLSLTIEMLLQSMQQPMAGEGNPTIVGPSPTGPVGTGNGLSSTLNTGGRPMNGRPSVANRQNGR